MPRKILCFGRISYFVISPAYIIFKNVFVKLFKKASFPGGSVVKNPAASAGGAGPGSGRPPGEGTHSSVLACGITQTEETGGLQSMESQKSWA